MIIERATLQHIPKPLAARYVQEMFAALKPGGRAFLKSPAWIMAMRARRWI
ncbi:MAG: hypothetical protein JKP95_03310 [Oceanicaulis sp.]|nr:hypothetical protein [Oceanicaulis sp.]